MSLALKKIFFAITFNSCLFFLLMIGIQNSSNKSKVNFLTNKTIIQLEEFITKDINEHLFYRPIISMPKEINSKDRNKQYKY